MQNYKDGKIRKIIKANMQNKKMKKSQKWKNEKCKVQKA